MPEKIEMRIECQTGKLLFRVCASGIKVWCERHKAEHLYTWGQLAQLEQSFNTPDIRVTIASSTTCILAS